MKKMALTMFMLAVLAQVGLENSTNAMGNSSSGGSIGPILSCQWQRFGTTDFYDVFVFDTLDPRPEYKYLVEITAQESGKELSLVGQVQPLTKGEGYKSFKPGQLRIEISHDPAGQIDSLALSGSAAPFAYGAVRYVPCNGSDVIQ